jgi:hypothetical protein
MPATAIPRPTHNVGPWPANLAHLLPPDAKAASDALADVLNRREQMGEAVDAARAAVENARREDDEAAIFAADHGEPAPKPTAPKSEAKLATVQREHDALKTVLTARQEQFLAAIRVAHAPLREAVTAEIAEVGGELREALAAAETALLRAADLRRARGQLGTSTKRLEGRAVVFCAPVPPRRRRREEGRDPLRGDLRHALDALEEWAGQE